MRDAEDLVDRLAVVRGLLDAHDREVELLQVLPALGQEHREILGNLIHARNIGQDAEDWNAFVAQTS
jgi:hypothetical protein